MGAEPRNGGGFNAMAYLSGAAGAVAMSLVVVDIGPPPVGPARMSGSHTSLIADSYVQAIAWMLILWFIATLRAHMFSSEGGAGRLSSLVLGGGIALCTLGVLAAAFRAAGSGPELGQAQVTGNVIPYNSDLLSYIANHVLSFASLPGVVMMTAACLLSLRFKVLPVALGYSAGVIALLGALASFSVFYDSRVLGPGGMPTMLALWAFIAWIFATSLTLTFRSRGTTLPR
ncbi:MAG: hypothetical protein ABR507_02820 [Actinomycetota bacterium]|nr:hypothetical protein [Actinomycetota bacterium]